MVSGVGVMFAGEVRGLIVVVYMFALSTYERESEMVQNYFLFFFLFFFPFFALGLLRDLGRDLLDESDSD